MNALSSVNSFNTFNTGNNSNNNNNGMGMNMNVSGPFGAATSATSGFPQFLQHSSVTSNFGIGNTAPQSSNLSGITNLPNLNAAHGNANNTNNNNNNNGNNNHNNSNSNNNNNGTTNVMSPHQSSNTMWLPTIGITQAQPSGFASPGFMFQTAANPATRFNNQNNRNAITYVFLFCYLCNMIQYNKI